MKFRLLILLLTTTALTFGQTPIDFEQLTNSWIQGKINQNGSNIIADVNRGGWYHLEIHSDTTVVFGDPFTCGFGHERHGKWTLSKTDTTIAFHFTESIGYLNNPNSGVINETETYKIKRLTIDDLILTQVVGLIERTWPFIRTEE